MRVKWGNKNESLTISVDGLEWEKHDAKLFLSIIEKQVCDRGLLRQVMRSRLGEAADATNRARTELRILKETKSLICKIRKFFSMETGI